MGLLSWLFGNTAIAKPAIELQPDRIFLTRPAMLRDFALQCGAALESHDRVLLVTHFEESRRAVLKQLKATQLSFEDRIERLNSHAAHSQLRAGVATLALADQLSADDTVIESHDQSLHIAVMIAERHPRRCHDERIEQFAASISGTASLTYFGSLEDAVHQRFAGAWVTDLLKKMGMQPDEVIESQMVTRRLIASQRQIESKMLFDTPANSAEEWCERNLPNL